MAISSASSRSSSINTKEENISIDVEQETQKLNALNKIFGFIEDKQTKAVLVNKYYSDKEHKQALRIFLDDMIKALDETNGSNGIKGKEETKKQLSYVT